MTSWVRFRSAAGSVGFGVLEGETVAECQDRVAAIIAVQKSVLVHPYDDPAIIAGQGTIALEMLEDVADLQDDLQQSLERHLIG